jgi:hypothetical protein
VRSTTRAGSVFVVLFAAAFVVSVGDLVGSFADPDRVFVDRFADGDNRIKDIAGSYFLALAGLAFVWFAHALSHHAKDNRAALLITGSAAAGGMIVAAAAWGTVPMSLWFGSLVDDPGLQEGQAVLPQFGYVALALGGMLPAAAFIALVGRTPGSSQRGCRSSATRSQLSSRSRPCCCRSFCSSCGLRWLRRGGADEVILKRPPASDRPPPRACPNSRSTIGSTLLASTDQARMPLGHDGADSTQLSFRAGDRPHGGPRRSRSATPRHPERHQPAQGAHDRRVPPRRGTRGRDSLRTAPVPPAHPWDERSPGCRAGAGPKSCRPQHGQLHGFRWKFDRKTCLLHHRVRQREHTVIVTGITRSSLPVHSSLCTLIQSPPKDQWNRSAGGGRPAFEHSDVAGGLDVRARRLDAEAGRQPRGTAGMRVRFAIQASGLGRRSSGTSRHPDTATVDRSVTTVALTTRPAQGVCAGASTQVPWAGHGSAVL